MRIEIVIMVEGNIEYIQRKLMQNIILSYLKCFGICALLENWVSLLISRCIVKACRGKAVNMNNELNRSTQTDKLMHFHCILDEVHPFLVLSCFVSTLITCCLTSLSDSLKMFVDFVHNSSQQLCDWTSVLYCHCNQQSTAP